LILFSEELFATNEKSESTYRARDLDDHLKSSNVEDFSLQETSIKTVNDLQRNVLYYGITPKDVNIYNIIYIYVNRINRCRVICM